MYVCMYMLPLSLQPLLRFYSSLCLENPPPDCITGGGSTEKKYTDENQGPSRHSSNIIHIHITKWVFRSLICQWDLSRWHIAECSRQAYERIWRNRSLHFPLYVFFLHGYNSLKLPACELWLCISWGPSSCGHSPREKWDRERGNKQLLFMFLH